MWKEDNNTLIRNFEFKNFEEAWNFMNKVALIAEKQQHHPDWRNVYNRVEIRLNTHDAGSVVTDKDHLLASEIDKIWQAQYF
jgi:4a-hydroxytetrahydrobiopterin dehydratase